MPGDRIPHSALPNGEMGAPHTNNTVNNSVRNMQACALTLLSMSGFVFIALKFAVPVLDRATAVQCKNHAWPAKAHQVHMDWCANNGYATN